ncbi:unnamed protein product [Merluccius merluccius]
MNPVRSPVRNLVQNPVWNPFGIRRVHIIMDHVASGATSLPCAPQTFPGWDGLGRSGKVRSHCHQATWRGRTGPASRPGLTGG